MADRADVASKQRTEAFVLANTDAAPVPLCPEIRLRLMRTDAPMKGSAPLVRGEPHLFAWDGPRPYWAFAWASGQGLARFIMDNPGFVRGLNVVDFGSGSGLCAIAAAMGGASAVTAVDIDPVALGAVRVNAALNDVAVATRTGIPREGWRTLLAADAFYHGQDPSRLLRHSASGRTVLIADPTCRGFPKDCCDELARYCARTSPELEEWTAEVQILRVRQDALARSGKAAPDIHRPGRGS